MPRYPFLSILLVVVSLALGWVMLPFYGTILWSAIIAMLFTQINRRLVRQLGGRRNLAALLTLSLVLFIVVLPLALISALISLQLTSLYQQIQSGQTQPIAYLQGVFGSLPAWARDGLAAVGLGDFATLQSQLSKVLTQGSQFIAARLFSFGQDTFRFMASVFVTLYIAFFLVRDGENLVQWLRRAVPMANRHKQDLLTRFGAVIRATVQGNLVIGGIQGVLGGLAFWVLDVSSALLWAVLMAFLSLIPVVGSALVWAPVAIYFLVTGAVWQSVALTVFGVMVIGLVDNLLRPVLVGRNSGLPDYMVLITTIGGIAVFGINGFVLGPVIAAMFMATWQIHLKIRD
jgi:predicted PurR-regulated permease PerM